MAYIAATVQDERVVPGVSWAVHTSTLHGGVDDGITLLGTDLVKTYQDGRDIVLDGITASIDNATAKDISLAAYFNGASTSTVLLMCDSSPATGDCHIIKTGLLLPIRLSPGILARLSYTTANTDISTLAMWGHWAPEDPEDLYPDRPTHVIVDNLREILSKR